MTRPAHTETTADDPDATRIVTPADPDATIVRPAAVGGAASPAVSRTQPLPRAQVDRDATVIRTRMPSDLGPPLPPGTPPLPRPPTLALAPGQRLHEYRIEAVLGQGGFGITYLATDTHLNAPVAIKEYLPEEIAFRAGDRSVSPNASRHRDRYRQGLESFLREARTLASLRHPAIVRVSRFFEAHRTAYMVMDFERGLPFKQWWPAAADQDEAALLERLLPLLDGLAVVHAGGFLHRDIKPENIQVREADGSLVLLDFGSAGQAVAAAEEGAVVLTPGYAPLEQYGLGVQGPWTDLYALGATLYWAVTGRKPPEAEQRAAAPSCHVPAVEAGAASGRYGAAFLQAIDWALEMDAARRPRDVSAWRRALCADHLAQLDLSEALRRQDSGFDGEAEARSRGVRWRLRLARGWAVLRRPGDWPLAFKLGAAMLATALLPMLATGLYNLAGSQTALADAERRLVQRLAQGTAERLSQFVDDGTQQAAALAVAAAGGFAPALQRADDPLAVTEANRRLAAISHADPEVLAAVLLDRFGQVPAASDPALLGRDFSFQGPFQAVIAGRSAVSGLVAVPGSDRPDLYLAAPVPGEDGQPLGVLMLQVDGRAIGRIVEAVATPVLTPLLVDADGIVVAHGDPSLRLKSLVPLAPDRLDALRADQRYGRDEVASLGEHGLAAAMVGARAVGVVAYRSAVRGRDEIAGFAPVPGLGWVLGVGAARQVFEAPLVSLERTLWWSVGLVGLLAAGLALRAARGIVRPLAALTAAAEALKAGDYAAAEVDVRRRDEVGQLARTFNVMVGVLRQRDRELRAGSSGTDKR